MRWHGLIPTVIVKVIDAIPLPGHTALIMKRLALLLFCTPLVFSPRLLAQDDCNKIQSESGKTQCLEQKLNKAELMMNSALDRVVACYSSQHAKGNDDLSGTPAVLHVVEEEDRLTTETLQKSQAHWQAYRDTTCEAVGHSFEGGSASAQAIPTCMLALTEERTKWLKTNFDVAFAKQKRKRIR